MVNHLRDWRVFREKTLEEVADATNSHKTQISKMELGQRGTTVDWLVKLAAVYGTTPDALLRPPSLPISADYGALADQFDQSLATLMAPGPAREWSETLVAIVRNWLEPSQSDPATVEIRPPNGPAGSPAVSRLPAASKEPAPR